MSYEKLSELQKSNIINWNASTDKEQAWYSDVVESWSEGEVIYNYLETEESQVAFILHVINEVEHIKSEGNASELINLYSAETGKFHLPLEQYIDNNGYGNNNAFMIGNTVFLVGKGQVTSMQKRGWLKTTLINIIKSP
jgi:hypothetical protein